MVKEFENLGGKSRYEMSSEEKKQWAVLSLRNLLAKIKADSSNEILILKMKPNLEAEQDNPPYYIPDTPDEVDKKEIEEKISKLLEILENPESGELDVKRVVDEIENMDDMEISGQYLNPRDMI